MSLGSPPAGEDSQWIQGLIGGDAWENNVIRRRSGSPSEHLLKHRQPEPDVLVHQDSSESEQQQLQQWENDEGRISAGHSIGGSTINEVSIAAYSGGEGGGGHETQLQSMAPKLDVQHVDDSELVNGRDGGDKKRGSCENCHLRRKTKVKVTTRAVDDKGGTARSLVPDYCPVEPFERYVKLHHNITEGTAEQR